MPSCSSPRLGWALVLALAVAGCLHRAPEGPATSPGVRVRALAPLPREVLERGAGSLDVTIRKRSLTALVAHAPAVELTAIAQRGLYDPSRYVRRDVVDSLAARLPEEAAASLLRGVLNRGDMDPFARAWAGAALVAHGDPEAAASLAAAWRAERSAWDRAPLALAAMSAGDAEAEAALAAALREGDVPLEPRLFLDLARSGHAGLVPALREARALLEEELLLPMGVALLLLGDSEGQDIVWGALDGDDELLGMEAVDLLRELSAPAAATLLRRAGNGRGGIVRTYAELVAVGRGEAPLGAAVAAAETEDPDQRCLAYEAIGLALGRLPRAEPLHRPERAAHDLVLQALDVGEPASRACAARALGGALREVDRAAMEGRLTEAAADADVEELQVEVAAALLELTPGG
ncbi:MAG: HEAT repeat domain-containing protein [Pseudomonadota bacterium]